MKQMKRKNSSERTSLTYSFPNFEPVHCSMSSSNCCFLSCIQVSQEAGNVIWYSYFVKNFSQLLCSTESNALAQSVKQKQIFLEFPCFFYDPASVGYVISGSSAFSKSGLYIWKFLVHGLLKLSLKDFEHFFASKNEQKIFS